MNVVVEPRTTTTGCPTAHRLGADAEPAGRPETGERYARPEFLWLVCPLLLYWLGRMARLDGLDEITHRHGGRVYLAKDARCAPERLREGYPRLGAFEAVRAEASGAPPRLASELSRRLAL